jgi:hypothetical protein
MSLATLTPTAPSTSPAAAPGLAGATAPDVTLTDDERQRCEVWTRVMGYHRPVASFNIGKQGEFRQRVPFVLR